MASDRRQAGRRAPGEGKQECNMGEGLEVELSEGLGLIPQTRKKNKKKKSIKPRRAAGDENVPSERSKSSWAAVASAKPWGGRKSLASLLSICEVESTLDQASGALNSAPDRATS